MKRLLNKVKNSKMCLIASIPINSYDLAKEAWEAGADAIKVHINVWHRASNNTFGSLQENKEVLTRILEDSPVPVGIVIGEDTFVAERQVEEVIKMGFDFISLYAHHTPASLAINDKISNFIAVNSTYSFDDIMQVANAGIADFLEMSICQPESYGQRLNGLDLAHYKAISEASPIPTVLPTQHVVFPSDIKILYECKISAIMVGAITMGKELHTISETLKAFRSAIDDL